MIAATLCSLYICIILFLIGLCAHRFTIKPISFQYDRFFFFLLEVIQYVGVTTNVKQLPPLLLCIMKLTQGV